MGDGPPGFRQEFLVFRRTQDTARCCFRFRLRGFHPLSADLSRSTSAIHCSSHIASPTTPTSKLFGLGSSRFARRYSGNRFFFLFLQVLRCFSSLRLPLSAMYSLNSNILSKMLGFPIRKSPDQSLLTAPRSISVLVPSFIGS